jgi:intracellular septation protein A
MKTQKITPKKKHENPLIVLGFNFILPALIMSKADDWFEISPKAALIIALMFPLGYGVLDFVKSKKFNIFSIIGFVSTFLTGIIGLLQLSKEYIAIKEAFMPSILGIIVFISAFTHCPMIKVLLFNDTIMDIDLINSCLNGKKDERKLQKLLQSSTLKFSFAFVLSAILNYALAHYFVHSDTGTVAFNKELARMTFWSYPIIVLPCTTFLIMILLNLMKHLERLTHLTWEEMLIGMQKELVQENDNPSDSKNQS